MTDHPTIPMNKDNDLKFRDGLYDPKKKKKEIKESVEKEDPPSLEYFLE